MVEMRARYGAWCLVAGAAEGLGKAFSMALAEKGMNVILVDQKKEELADLSSKIQSTHGIQTRTLYLDLVSDDSTQQMMEVIASTSCRLLVYNAAFSKVQKFLDNDYKDLDRYIRVNIRAPVTLIHSFCKLHSNNPDERKGIVLMSSLAGSWGAQLLAPYGASKAYLHIFAESLNHEMKASGFDILATIAGATLTPGYITSNPQEGKKLQSAMSPERVVKASLDSLGHRSFIVPGIRNKLIFFLLSRVLSRRTSLKLMNRSVGKVYRAKL